MGVYIFLKGFVIKFVRGFIIKGVRSGWEFERGFLFYFILDTTIKSGCSRLFWVVIN